MKSKKNTFSIKKLNEITKKENAAFEKMSKAQKRIAIAKDVIKSLKTKKFNATSGTYFSIHLKEKKDFLKPEVQSANLELQSILQCDLVTCNVCAIGGIFASKVNLGNKCAINVEKGYGDEEEDIDSPDDYEMIKNLKSIFGEKELRAIEYAFEGDDIDETFAEDDEFPHEKYYDFYRKYDDDGERMIAIMENIIKNKGKFKP